MPKKWMPVVALLCCASAVLPGANWQGRAQTAQAQTYPAAAPLDQYLIHEKASEIELARSAAPASISDGAEILVLSKI